MGDGALKIGFLGLGGWGLASMQAIIASRHELAWVIVHPDDDPRFELPFAASLTEHATRLGIPVVEAVNTREPAVAEMPERLPVDLVISSNWRTHIHQGFYEGLRHGGLNVHRSLLPRYGGFAPLNWAVANGETETGVSIHALANQFDSGVVLGQRRIGIASRDTATDLFHRSGEVIAELLPDVLDGLADGRDLGRRQDLATATFFHERTQVERRIDWSKSAPEVERLIRAQSDPFPNAFGLENGKRLAIKRCVPGEPRFRGTPGRIVSTAGLGVIVICGRGGPYESVLVTEVEPEAGEPCPAVDHFKTTRTRYLE
jgi:methionyl-tRNA formyltransferase